jgi:hypothetical protein
MTATHTSTPWRSENGQIFGLEPSCEEAEVLVCDVAPGGSALTEYDIGNVKFIVLACNTHDILVNALMLIEQASADMNRYADTDMAYIERMHNEQIIRIARAALAYAGPGHR